MSKLYTEEQVLNMLRSFHNLEMNVQLCMLKLTPIELPTDEEIEKYAQQNAFNYYEFITGAKWYREQLKNKQS